MKKISKAGVSSVLTIGLVVSGTPTPVWAVDPIKVEQQGSVIGDDVLYSIGGGSAVTMGTAGQMQSIKVGLGWQTNPVCGNMDLNTTLENQLNGATNGFKSIMSSVVSAATSAVASLPALLLQRANPALYNLITNGILQARLDYDRSKGTCRAIAEKMADVVQGPRGWDAIAQGQKMGSILSRDSDAVSAISEVEEKSGDDGVTWVGGEQAAGAGQPAIEVIADVTRAGYNLLTRRDVMETSSVSSDECSNGLVCGTWSSPSEAVEFANRVLGEQQIRTCEGCAAESTPGVGLVPLIQETYETKLQALSDLLNSSTEPTPEQLRAASSDSLPITRGVIAALRDERDQAVLAQRLASEVSLSDVLSKALMLLRLLLSGAKESNVSANDLAVSAVDRQTEILEKEINSVRMEMDLRRELAQNSPMQIITRARAGSDTSNQTIQGDTQSDRLLQLQAPSSETQ